MKKLLKIVGGIFAVILFVALAGVTYLQVALPDVGDAPDLKINATPEVLARGKYLANNVSLCIFCHSDQDYNYYAGPVVPGTEGKGGFAMSDPAVGVLYPRNITPAGIGDWTDGEIVRAITAGVDKDGEPLFPMMPFEMYNEMAESDVQAIVAYLRTLSPIENEVPDSEISFPLNLIMRMIPKPYSPGQLPAKSDTLALGKYLTTIAGCHMCHTPIDDKGKTLPGMDFAGGFEFFLPTGRIVRSANITSHYDLGIGAWDKAYFIGRFKEYADSTKNHIPVSKDGDNTMMPWLHFAGMTVEDLTAIYGYLRTVAPVENAVEKHPK